MLQNRSVLLAYIITIWKSTDSCAYNYCGATALYLFSVLSRIYNIITYRGGGPPRHGREAVDGFNATNNSFI